MRRVVAKADHLPESAKIDARTPYDDAYCARAQVENRIKGSSWICQPISPGQSTGAPKTGP